MTNVIDPIVTLFEQFAHVKPLTCTANFHHEILLNEEVEEPFVMTHYFEKIYRRECGLTRFKKSIFLQTCDSITDNGVIVKVIKLETLKRFYWDCTNMDHLYGSSDGINLPSPVMLPLEEGEIMKILYSVDFTMTANTSSVIRIDLDYTYQNLEDFEVKSFIPKMSHPFQLVSFVEHLYVDIHNIDIIKAYTLESRSVSRSQRWFDAMRRQIDDISSEDEFTNENFSAPTSTPEPGWVSQVGLPTISNLFENITAPFEETNENFNELILQAMSVLPEISSATSSFSKTSSKLEALIDSYGDENARNTIKGFLNKVEVNTDLKSISEDFYASAAILFLSAACVFAAFKQDRSSLIYVIIGVIACMLFARSKIVGFFVFMQKYLKFGDTISQSDILENVVTSATILLTTFVVGSTSITKMPKEIMTFAIGFPKIKQTFKDIFIFFLDMTKLILKYVGLGAWLGDIGYIKYQSKFIGDLFDEAERIFDAQAKSKYYLTEENYDKFLKTYMAFKKLQIEMPRSNETAGVATAILNVLRKFEEIRSAFGHSQFGFTGVRHEPYNTILIGGVGTHKSEIKEQIADAIMVSICDEEMIERRKLDRNIGLYNCSPEIEFHDEYHTDTVGTLLDDLFQQIDCPGMSPNEKFLFIRMGNMNPFALPCAAIHNKGNTYFKSDFIIATTNARWVKSEAIIEPDAVVRRFHLSVMCHPRPYYCTKETMHLDPYLQKFDKSKFDINDQGVTSIDQKYFMFSGWDMIKKRFTGVTYSFMEIVLKNVAGIEERKRWRKDREVKLAAITKQYEYIKNYQTVRDEHGMVDIEETMKSTYDATYGDIHDKFSGHSAAHPDIPDQWISQALKMEDFSMLREDPHVHPKIILRINERDESLVLKIISEIDLEQENRIDCLVNQYRIYGRNLRLRDVVLISIQCHGQKFIKSLLVEGEDLVQYYVDNPYICLDNIELIYMSMKPIRDYIFGTGTSVFRRLSDSVDGFKEWLCSYLPSEGIERGLVYMGENPLKCWMIFFFATAAVEFVVTKFFGTSVESHVSDGNQAGYRSRQPSKSVGANALKSSMKDMFVKQSTSFYDPSGIELCDSIINSNMYQFGILHSNKEEITNFGYVTFVKGRHAIMPFHFLQVIGDMLRDGTAKPSSIVVIHKTGVGNSKPARIVLTVSDVFDEECYHQNDKMEGNDVVVVRFPPHVPTHRDIIKNFIQESDCPRLLDKPYRAIFPKSDRWKELSGNARLQENLETLDTKICTGFEYDGTTNVGDCGGLFTILNPSSPLKKIAGLHAAGNALRCTGFSMKVTQEMINDSLALFNDIPIFRDDAIVPQSPRADSFADGQFINVRNSDISCPVAFSSEIRRSVIYNKFSTSLEIPCKLKPFEVDGITYDPYALALSNYGRPAPVIDTTLIGRATNCVFDSLLKCSKKLVCKEIYSIEEAVRGLSDDKDFGSIPRNTSPGFPLNTENHPGFPKKTYWLGKDPEFVLDSLGWIELKHEVERRNSLAAKGIICENIFADNLKDETKSVEKVMKGKTRLFSGSPLPYTVQVRMFFGAFILWIHKNRVDNHCAIGLNPYSDEWDKMFHKLSVHIVDEKDAACGAGDYKGFDSSQLSVIFGYILKIIQKWYNGSPEENRVRAVLWEDVMHSVHIRGTTIYEWTNSLPSGHPLTLVINYLYNYLCFQYCWLRVTHELPEIAGRFDDFVYVIFMGDDNLFSVHPLVRDVFNEMTLVDLLAELGLTYTNESKTKSLVKLRTWKEVSFMKRSFLRHRDGKYLAPLELKSVFECLNWSKKGPEYLNITKQNIDSSIRELSLHGRDVFDKYAIKLANIGKLHLEHWPPSTDFDTVLETVRNYESYF